MPARTLFVAGARRGAGKTLVSAFLLRSLPGTGAVKVTCCRTVGGCPRERPCGVCRALSGPFAVIQDRQTLAQPGKDSARLLAAATGRVVWLQSRPEALAEGLAAALAVFQEERAVIVEGNAAFQVAGPRFIGAAISLSPPAADRDPGPDRVGTQGPAPTGRDLGTSRPDLGLLVIGPGPEPPKSSVGVALPFVQGIVLNARPGFPPPVMMEGLPQNVRTFSFDAARPESDPQARAFAQWVADALGM